MKYDFDTVFERKGHDAAAFDAIGSARKDAPSAPMDGFSVIPMWIADMNFRTCPSVKKAIIERAEYDTMGYFSPYDTYYNAIIQWHNARKPVDGLEPVHIAYHNGVLGGVISALNVLCSRGDPVLVNAPTYAGFINCLKANGYNIIPSFLRLNNGDTWQIDFDDMEKKIKDNNIHVFILCSPHNPCGRVWTGEELIRILDICRKYEVYVISDEIWSDIIMPGHRHIPTQSVNEYARERTIALYAPTKTFNTAGLVGSYSIVFNKFLRDRLERESELCSYNEMNVLSMHALMGAYSPDGSAWTDELIHVLDKNATDVVNFFRNDISDIKVAKPEGTYMLLVDCTDYCASHSLTISDVIKAGWNVGLAWADGRFFNAPCHLRLNVALPQTLLNEAMKRMQEYVFT